jgi:hypothetical protein
MLRITITKSEAAGGLFELLRSTAAGVAAGALATAV